MLPSSQQNRIIFLLSQSTIENYFDRIKGKTEASCLMEFALRQNNVLVLIEMDEKLKTVHADSRWSRWQLVCGFTLQCIIIIIHREHNSMPLKIERETISFHLISTITNYTRKEKYKISYWEMHPSFQAECTTTMPMETDRV